MDLWLLAVTSDPAAKDLAKDQEVAGAGPVHCHFWGAKGAPIRQHGSAVYVGMAVVVCML